MLDKLDRLVADMVSSFPEPDGTIFLVGWLVVTCFWRKAE
jgi:hypothetical protein